MIVFVLASASASGYYYGYNAYPEYKAYWNAGTPSYGGSYGFSPGYSQGATQYYTSYYNNGYKPLSNYGFQGGYYNVPYHISNYYADSNYNVVYAYPKPNEKLVQVPHYYKYTTPTLVVDATNYPSYQTQVSEITTVTTSPKPDIGIPTRTTYFHNNYNIPTGFSTPIY